MSNRSWAFTYYYKDDDDREEFRIHVLSLEEIRKCIFQAERCPNTGKLHLQGYVGFEKPIRQAGIKKLFNRNSIHLEICRYSEEVNARYCSKSASFVDGPWSKGDFSKGQGQRSDLENIRSLIVEGKSDLEIADAHFATWCRNERSFTRYRSLLATPRNSPMEVLIYWGDAGTGKTRAAHDRFRSENIYPVPQPNQSSGAFWFDGYVGQQCILLDDFYGWLPIAFLLKFMDRYPMQLPVKQGFRPFMASTTTIIFTSNSHYNEWYKWESFPSKLWDAFKRRITEEKEFIIQ